MKVSIQTVLLIVSSIIGVSASEDRSYGLGLAADIYVPDPYNNFVKDHIVLFDTNRNTSESNYPNTVSFYLYTKHSGNNSVQLFVGDTNTLKNSPFDVKKPTVIITHGWANSYQSPICTYIHDAYVQYGDYNMIIIDWSVIAAGGLFMVGAQVEKVAKYVTRMIDFLESQGMDPSTTTMVGHSFGAHLVGLASYYAKRKVNYVVGLDPAGPVFFLKDKSSRLSKDDATYVQAIHTTTVFGLADQLGHSDFYANGGMLQKGCGFDAICGHYRSYEFFAESVNSKSFIARKCDSYTNYKLGKCNSNESVYMGGAVPDPNAHGTYYLETNAKPPFAKNGSS